MTPPPNPTHQGRSSELISHIHHLQQLLNNRPAHLPFNPETSTYHFGLDTELVDEEGVWFAFNRNLEGDRFDALIKMIRATVKGLPTDKKRAFLREVWLEWLIKAAELQGGKVSAKRKQAAADRVSEVGDNGKHARTLAGGGLASEREPSEPESDLDTELARDSETVTPRSSFQQKVSIQLSGEIKSAPRGWNSSAPKRQLTFDDLQWKRLETEEEKADQRKALRKRDKEMWGPVELRYALRVATFGNDAVKPALRTKNWQQTPRYGVIFSNATTPALCVTVASIQKATVSPSFILP
ncbi:hypothetical protein BU15DRAFT_74835 [Melanogaster broomeanus]|nr:hypothetical protein BU15DRAFT_74835 [Melanogaster broomeanus]